MFLNGGIMTDQEGILVASPGDVIASHIVKRLLGTFDKVHPKTVIMIIKSLDAKYKSKWIQLVLTMCHQALKMN